MNSENAAMNVSAADRFAELLARHGADPSRWPPHEQAWMQECRRGLDGADALLHDAAALDAWLDTAPVPPPPRAELRLAILASAANAPRQASAPRSNLFATLAALWRDLGGNRLAAPALAMALAVGVGFGWMLQPPTAISEVESEDFLALAQFDDHYTELLP